MRILLIDETYPPDTRGSIPYAPDLFNYLVNKGDSVDVLTVGDARTLKVEEVRGGRILRMPRHFEIESSRLSFSMLRFLFHKMQSYEVVHINHPTPSGEISYVLCKALRRLGSSRLLVTFHADVVSAKRLGSTYNRLITREIMRDADRIIVGSPTVAKTSCDLADFQDKIDIIPYGIDLKGWDMRGRSSHVAPLELRADCFPHLLFVGRLVRYKGIHVLLDAMVDTPGFLYVVGDGPLRDRVRAQYDALGIQDRVKLLGRVSDDLLANLYAWADVLILPSIDRGESFGYVLTEAMAHETALISTEIGTGTSWVNVHGETGLVVQPNNPKLLREAIISLAQQPQALATFKRNARHRVEELFTLDRMLSEHYRIYQALAGKSSGREISRH